MYNDIYVNFSTNDKLILIKLLINRDIDLFMFLTCSSAATMYMANTGKTAPFIVMETDILSNGMPSNNICETRVQYQITTLKSLNSFTFSAILDHLMHEGAIHNCMILLHYLHIFNRINCHSGHSNITMDSRVIWVISGKGKILKIIFILKS